MDSSRPESQGREKRGEREREIEKIEREKERKAVDRYREFFLTFAENGEPRRVGLAIRGRNWC